MEMTVKTNGSHKMRLRIQYFSDLHLEFLKKLDMSALERSIQVCAPVLVLSGDIGDPLHPSYKDFLQCMSNRFEKIFLLSGNHEYYGKDIISTENAIRNICAPLENVSYLQNSFEDWRGFRFAGTTLWSSISDPDYLTNDFHYIEDMTVHAYNALHTQSKRFIEEMLTSQLPVVMLTHHLPSHGLTDPCYASFRNYQQCYSSNCDYLLRDPIVCWIYGHTHRSFTGRWNSVHMCCNPVGYIGENPTIDLNKIVDVSAIKIDT